MGVFGMLAVALLVFVLRQMSTEENWRKVEKYVRVSFWGLNIGLALMVALSLFPSGVLQLLDVIRNGYWHARGAAFLDSRHVSAGVAADAGGRDLHRLWRRAAVYRDTVDLAARRAEYFWSRRSKGQIKGVRRGIHRDQVMAASRTRLQEVPHDAL